ncbi:agmatinase [Siminovitchia sp. FSL H7-0308]|uniref:Agmatinase n=1 Tax=Siminovitchia thermophila TaxID=1245522 RepID=A0ABS2R7Z2_9BACI|nr:agmatinase [Siminovitchia thermophila]MBM7715490.1 agmatinase [Siminovitchia thermophila]ONK21418.1 agmatinase [Bacillus sp. VT-16-64]
MANDTWSTVLHAGLATFMKRPYMEPNRQLIKEAGVKAGILGIPFDGTTIVRTGSTMGPRRFRDCSSLYIPYHLDYDVDVVEKYNVHDFGDINVVIGNAFETLESGKRDILELLHGGAMPVVIGGEHLVTVAATRALEEFNPNANYGFILFDAHLDTAPDVGGDKWNHCCPVPRSMELSCFNPKNAVIIGPHGSMNPKEELEYVRENDISLFTMRDIYKNGIEAVVKQAIEIASDGTDGVYITFDMDSLEASQTPGTCAPTPGGITVREMIQAIDLLGEVNLVGFDVVEIAPPYDHSDITAITASRMVVDMLASRARYL